MGLEVNLTTMKLNGGKAGQRHRGQGKGDLYDDDSILTRLE